MNTRLLTRFTAVAIAVAGLAVAGCTQADRDQASVKTDQAAETVKDKSADLAADAKQAGSEIKADVKEATADAKAKTNEIAADIKDSTADARADASRAIDNAKAAVTDAAITTSVKAELATDDVLKARDINVETDAGTVVLRGTAPSTTAKDRATSLASSVKGVVTVKNELTIAPKS